MSTRELHMPGSTSIRRAHRGVRTGKRGNAVIIAAGAAVLVVLAAGSGGCFGRSRTRGTDVDVLVRAVDGGRAFEYVRRFVALGPRPSGSAGAERAANWIADECRNLGWTPEIDEWKEWKEQTPLGPCVFRNVLVKVPGRGRRYVLVGAHYDTKRLPDAPDFVGANDSGSGVGVLLELLRVIRQTGAWAGPPLLVAFFDGEECVVRYGPRDGLHGSRRLAGRLDAFGGRRNCAAVIVLDMIGDRDLTITLPQDTPPALAQAVFRAAESEGGRDRVGWFLRAESILDDHTPFQRKGIPAVDLIDFEYGPDNAWWHTDQDTLDKLSPESLAFVGRLCLRVIMEAAALRPK